MLSIKLLLVLWLVLTSLAMIRELKIKHMASMIVALVKMFVVDLPERTLCPPPERPAKLSEPFFCKRIIPTKESTITICTARRKVVMLRVLC